MYKANTWLFSFYQVLKIVFAEMIDSDQRYRRYFICKCTTHVSVENIKPWACSTAGRRHYLSAGSVACQCSRCIQVVRVWSRHWQAQGPTCLIRAVIPPSARTAASVIKMLISHVFYRCFCHIVTLSLFSCQCYSAAKVIVTAQNLQRRIQVQTPFQVCFSESSRGQCHQSGSTSSLSEPVAARSAD